MKNVKKIKQILVDGQGWVYSKDNEITEIFKNGEMALVSWYEQGNREYNGKYVLIVEYED